MSKRLGETLVAAGEITEAQLQRALTAQLVFGGHLGTSLLELGFLDETALGETLSEVFPVPYADFETLSRVPYAVIRSLPSKLVEKHKVVPLRLAGRTLHLAMIDPKNLLALDEISFVTGYRIVPEVAPEVRILQALEKYYGVPRSQRFVTLSRELSRLASPRNKLNPLETEEVFLDANARPQRTQVRVAANEVTEARVDTAKISASKVASVAEPMMDHWEKYGYGRSWREVADALEVEPDDVRPEEADTRPQPRAERANLGRVDAPRAATMLTDVTRQLATSQDVSDVISTVLSYTAGRLTHSIVFVLRAGSIVAWASRGRDLSSASLRTLDIPPDEAAGVFSLVDAERPYFLDAPPVGDSVKSFYARIGLQVPRTALIVPIMVKGRTTAYLYGDGGDREILAIDLPSMLTLCTRAGLALQILILRNKILAS